MTSLASSRADPFPVEAFEEHRQLLFGVAYRMLGSVGEAEDAVQETYLRARTANISGDLLNPRAYFVTILTRICLDEAKSSRRRRGEYVGQWLPEPLLTSAPELLASPQARIDAEESISLAFLVLLESLGPVERAVFLLRDVFDYGYHDVASIVGRNEPAVRQILRRARQHVDARRHRHRASRVQQEELTRRFLRAAGEGDMQGLLELLSEDVTAWSDGGGKTTTARNPIHGSDRVARFVIGVTRKERPVSAELVAANGGIAVLTHSRWGPRNVLQIDANTEGRIIAIRTIRNPDKLRAFA